MSGVVSAIRYLEALQQRELLCDDDCEDYGKKCVIREQHDTPYFYCYDKKRKREAKT